MVTNHPISEEPCPDVQSEHYQLQLPPISLCPISNPYREETSTSPSTACTTEGHRESLGFVPSYSHTQQISNTEP